MEVKMSVISGTDEYKDAMDAGILLNSIYGSIARVQLCSTTTLRIVLNRLQKEKARLDKDIFEQQVINDYIKLILSEIESRERGDYN
jgi:hypothetical protein